MKAYKVLFIDLDETLYAKTNGLWRSISDRINQFIVDRLQISAKDAQELREYYLENYGTTLNGLLTHHNVDPLDYLDYVHDIPIEEMIHPEPEIREVLKQLSSKKFVFTNASYQHANRVLKHLDILDLFDGIIDIQTLDYMNKPRNEAYTKALSLSGNPDPYDCMLIDDRIVNLLPAKKMGITTVLVGEAIQDSAVDFSIDSVKELLREVPGLK